MAVKTLYIKNAAASGSNFGSLQDGGSAPSTATTTTGWTTSRGTLNNSSPLDYNVEQAVGTFSSTAYPNAAPSNTNGDAWRTENAISGTFANSAWSLSFSVIAVSAANTNTMRLRIRVWASTSQDGSNARELTSATVTTGSTTASLSTSTAQTITASWSPGSFSLQNEYLFVQTACEITLRGSTGTTQDMLFRTDGTNSKITTADFVAGNSYGDSVSETCGASDNDTTTGSDSTVEMLGLFAAAVLSAVAAVDMDGAVLTGGGGQVYGDNQTEAAGAYEATNGFDTLGTRITPDNRNITGNIYTQEFDACKVALPRAATITHLAVLAQSITTGTPQVWLALYRLSDGALLGETSSATVTVGEIALPLTTPALCLDEGDYAVAVKTIGGTWVASAISETGAGSYVDLYFADAATPFPGSYTAFTWSWAKRVAWGYYVPAARPFNYDRASTEAATAASDQDGQVLGLPHTYNEQVTEAAAAAEESWGTVPGTSTTYNESLTEAATAGADQDGAVPLGILYSGNQTDAAGARNTEASSRARPTSTTIPLIFEGGQAPPVGSSATARVDLPALTKDDIVIAVGNANVSVSTNTVYIDNGSAWTQFFYRDATNNRPVGGWYRRATGDANDPTSITMTNSDGANGVGVEYLIYRGAKTSGSPFNAVGTVAYASATSVTATGITTTVDGCQILLLGSNGGGTYRPVVNSGLPTVQQVDAPMRTAFDSPQTTAGATGDCVVAWSDAGSHTGNVVLVALEPAAVLPTEAASASVGQDSEVFTGSSGSPYYDSQEEKAGAAEAVDGTAIHAPTAYSDTVTEAATAASTVDGSVGARTYNDSLGETARASLGTDATAIPGPRIYGDYLTEMAAGSDASDAARAPRAYSDTVSESALASDGTDGSVGARVVNESITEAALASEGSAGETAQAPRTYNDSLGETATAADATTAQRVLSTSYVQSASNINTASGITSITVTMGAATTTGNLLIAFVREGSNNTDTPSMADTAGNVWRLVGRVSGWSTARAAMYYAANATSATTVTATFSTSGGVTRASMVVYEISGADPWEPLDVWASASGATVTSLTTGALTTAMSGEFLIVGQDVGSDQASWTAGSGFTLPSTAWNARDSMSYEAAPDPVTSFTTTPSWPTAANAHNIFAAFKPVIGGPLLGVATEAATASVATDGAVLRAPTTFNESVSESAGARDAAAAGRVVTIPAALYANETSNTTGTTSGPDVLLGPDAGQWVEYTINVTTAGSYELLTPVTAHRHGTLQVFDGETLIDTLKYAGDPTFEEEDEPMPYNATTETLVECLAGQVTRLDPTPLTGRVEVRLINTDTTYQLAIACVNAGDAAPSITVGAGPGYATDREVIEALYGTLPPFRATVGVAFYAKPMGPNSIWVRVKQFAEV